MDIHQPAAAVDCKNCCFVAFLQDQIGVEKQQYLLTKFSLAQGLRILELLAANLILKLVPHATACIEQQHQDPTIAYVRCWECEQISNSKKASSMCLPSDMLTFYVPEEATRLDRLYDLYIADPVSRCQGTSDASPYALRCLQHFKHGDCRATTCDKAFFCTLRAFSREAPKPTCPL